MNRTTGSDAKHPNSGLSARSSRRVPERHRRAGNSFTLRQPFSGIRVYARSNLGY